MKKFVDDLTPLHRVICSPGYDEAIDYVQGVLPCTVHEYPASKVRNGWTIPPSSLVTSATISRDGGVIYDGLHHPLATIALTAPFSGRVDRDELRRHLHFHHGDPKAIPFHYRQQFRNWDRDWGFCVPREFFDALEPGEYEVEIVTEESPGVLKVLEHVKAGASEAAIIIGANLDRPGVANDGVAAAAVGVEIMRRLRDHDTRYTYVLTLVPSTLGSEYYLGGLDPARKKSLMGGVFLEMLGSRTELLFQTSRAGTSLVDLALRASLAEAEVVHRDEGFAQSLVNDEHVWEAHGVPMSSLSRFPYPEYHSSLDGADIIHEEELSQAADLLMGMIDRIEASQVVIKKFEGTVCLSNPEYDLFVDPGEVVFGTAASDQVKALRQLMDLIPSLERPTLVSDLAARVGLSEGDALAYLERWKDKGLLEIL